MRLAQVEKVLIGKSVPYSRGAQSAIDKQVQQQPLLVTALGFELDEQGDPRFHGGLEKALHCYPAEHYRQWRQELGDRQIFQQVGAFGENLSTVGVSEESICLGDKVRIGTTLLQVSQGRMPCWKLNDRCAQPDMALRLQITLRTGWYFRVLESGMIAAGDEMTLIERPYPEWPLSRVMKLIFQGCLNKTELTQLLELPLVESWRALVEKRLEKGLVEDWSLRLFGAV